MPLKKSSIARRFILYIVLFSSFITVIITAFQLYRDYENDLDLIQSELEQIDHVHLGSLSAALWASNSKLLQTNIEGILQIRDIQYVAIYDKDKKWAQAGEVKGDDYIERSYAMKFYYRNKDINIGTLTVNVSLDGVYQRLIDKIWVILISNAIKTSLVALFIYFLFYRFVARHLSTIASFLENHDPLENSEPLYLSRSKKNNDEFDGVVESINDMHARLNEQVEKLNKSYTLLDKITERVPGMVYQFKLDADGNMSFPYMSNAVNELYNFGAEEVLENVNRIFSQTHPDDVQKLDDSIKESSRTLTPWKLEYRIINDDGKVRWFYGDSVPERMDDGGTLWHGFVTDITAKKELDETLKRSQKMDALGKLTGGIAHDYNNMLGVILGYAELLELMIGDQPELKNYLSEITHAGERGAKLTKKLLSFSRSKASDAEILNMNVILQEDQHMLEKTLTARIKLNLKLENDLWPVYLDESELEDALLNLSINAMHAIKNNGQIIIETTNEQLNTFDAIKFGLKPGKYVRLCIVDDGCGIDEETIEKIFDPFYSTKGEKGTGLGLSQVFGFITRCGGIIKVDSIVGKGTRFELYFPAREGDENNKDQAKARKKPFLKGKETILAVDDEPALLNLISKILSQKGYEVFCAENAKQALEIIDVEHIDLMISDIVMPDMDGYELATLVEKKSPGIKILLVSGYSGEGKDESELSRNLLNKPYSFKDLLGRIRDLLEQ